MLFRIAVIQERTHVVGYIFSKAAWAALIKLYSVTNAFLFNKGMVRRAANLENISGELLVAVYCVDLISRIFSGELKR